MKRFWIFGFGFDVNTTTIFYYSDFIKPPCEWCPAYIYLNACDIDEEYFQ